MQITGNTPNDHTTFFTKIKKTDGAQHQGLKIDVSTPSEQASITTQKPKGAIQATFSQEIQTTMLDLQETYQTEALPLEHYQAPKWMSEYSTQVSLKLGTPYGESTSVGSKVPTQGTPQQRAEYSALFQKNYEATLKEAGITSLHEHYQQLIVDQVRSEEIRLNLEERINNDEEMNALKKAVFG